MLCPRCASRGALLLLLQLRLRLQHSDDDTVFKEKRILFEDAQKSSKAFFRQHYVNYYLNTPIVLLYNRASRRQTALHRFRILTRLLLSTYSLARTLESLLCTRHRKLLPVFCILDLIAWTWMMCGLDLSEVQFTSRLALPFLGRILLLSGLWAQGLTPIPYFRL